MRGTSREEDEAGEEGREKIEPGGSGGHSPQEGADAAEELRHVARTRSSPNESLLKIFSDTREREEEPKKKIRGRIGNVRKKEREGKFSHAAVLIWPSERDGTMSRRVATPGVDPGAISRELLYFGTGVLSICENVSCF